MKGRRDRSASPLARDIPAKRNQKRCYGLLRMLERLRCQPANVEGTMKRAMFVCLLFGILACPGFSQSSGDSKSENLRNSFAGLGACDLSELRSAQAKQIDRKSTRLNSSHGYISYAVFCLKKKKHNQRRAATDNKATRHS